MSEPVTGNETIGGTGLDPNAVTIAALRQALATGAVTAQDLTAFYLSRIERLNPVLHAVISVSAHAVADAKASDEARARGAAPRPLEGIPVLVDALVADTPSVVIGSGVRRSKLVLPGKLVASLPGAKVIEGLAR